MLWHNGAIMKSSAVQVIYWGTSWSAPVFVGDKITGLESWYLGFNNSNYAKTSDEYTGTNGQVGPTVSYGGYIADYSKASGGNNTSNILGEVCKVIKSPVANGYYPV